MSIERIIEVLAWIITAGLLLWLVPKNKIREANVIFFFKQLMTWVLGLSIAEMDLIEYPVRFFSKATRSSFTFEYFVYPAICVFFNLYYPEGKSWVRQFIYYFLYIGGMTVFEVLLEQNTQMIKYINWTWYWTAFWLFVTFFVSRLYYKWFFSKVVVVQNNS